MTISFDISTSCIGYAVFSNDDKLIELNFIKLNSKHSLFQRSTEFKKKIEELKLVIKDVNFIVIEEPLKKFKGKYSSADTIAKLNFFNGMLSSCLFNMFNIEPVYYNVNHARKTVFPDYKLENDGSSSKHQIWERVVKLEPQINWKYGIKSRTLVVENYDSCDAYVVGRAHLITMTKQRKKLL